MPRGKGTARRGRPRKPKVEVEVEVVETAEAETNGDGTLPESNNVPEEVTLVKDTEVTVVKETEVTVVKETEVTVVKETEVTVVEPESESNEVPEESTVTAVATVEYDIASPDEISETTVKETVDLVEDSVPTVEEVEIEGESTAVEDKPIVEEVIEIKDSGTTNLTTPVDDYEEMETEEEEVLLLDGGATDELLGVEEEPKKEVSEPEEIMDVDQSKANDSEEKEEEELKFDYELDVDDSPKRTKVKSKSKKKGDKKADDSEPEREPDTETVSEDELPTEGVKQAPVSDAEAETVSDEELPRESSDDVHLDTEAVSDDELPPVKKRNRDVKAESSTQEVSKGKKRAASSSSPDATSSKKAAIESKPVVKTLPELEKYWKAVREDPADFTGWTYLLQYVDQENDVEAAREAYDTFLAHYPYCYGYWRKYADYEKKKGDKSRSQEVFERGLTAIPLSVDLWLHYLNHIKATRKEEEDFIRSQYERAIEVCGIEFRSDRLWDNYIKWETDLKNPGNVCVIYDRLFSVPTLGYKAHFENFEDFVMSNQPNKMLSVDEFLTLRAEVLQKLKQKPPSETAPAANAPPGDESDEDADKGLTYADEETKLMREKIIQVRKKKFKEMSSAVLDRWNFEEGIKRPYFHVKPLERCQLNNWREYLDFEIKEGSSDRIIVLFERCLIACALYDEFWVKYIRYLESVEGDDMKSRIRDVYRRACTIHHPKKPMLALNWAYFEENQGDADASRTILERIEKDVPNSLQIAVCRINLERRSGNVESASNLYEHYIESYKSKYIANALAIKYARFCQKVLGDVDRGVDVLRKAIDKDKDNPRLYHQLLDLVFSRGTRGIEQEKECLAVMDQFLERTSTDVEHKVLFAQHKVEFLEDFGASATSVQSAVADYLALLKQLKEKRRKQFEDKNKDEKKGKGDTSQTSAGSTYPSTQTTNSGSGYSAGYSSSGSNQQYGSSYGQPPYSQYNSQSDPNYNNYQNWNYSQTGYNNYNQGWGGYNYY